MPPTAPRHYAVYCRVVDNHGDAGVCWRLARLLAGVHGRAVTLWIDDAAALAALVPGVDPALAAQAVDGISIRSLRAAPDAAALDSDVVIEAFGCGLPEACLDMLERRRHVWINLEYLSAEAWVDDRHGLPSPQPVRPLTRWFFFPGFTPATGGLLREPDLLARRAAFARTPRPARPARISLFCYENAALPALLETWAGGGERLDVQVPVRVATASLARWLGAQPRSGEIHRRGALQLEVIGWVPQPGFDARLWASDFNIVRGEDSFVRAQWAARPFAWHIYPQAGHAHRVKLAAFLARYLAGADPGLAAAVRAFWTAFDREDGPATAAAWPALWAARAAFDAHARQWAAHLETLPELAASLVQFAQKRYN
jgi:uncharacterized repeat protein (TIGR03837 family)